MILRRADRLTDYRSVLARRGDIELGAYARRRWWRNVFAALFGVGLILGAAWLYRALRPLEEGVVQGREYPEKVRCSECKYEAIVQVQARSKFPLACPKCKVRSCRKVWRCQECGTEFVAKPQDYDRELSAKPGEATIRCPSCGSLAVGGAVDTPATQPARQP